MLSSFISDLENNPYFDLVIHNIIYIVIIKYTVNILLTMFNVYNK